MARIKGGLNAKKKHNRTLKLAKGYRGARSKQYLSLIHIYNCIILCRGLSEDHSGTVPDSWIWNYRISG